MSDRPRTQSAKPEQVSPDAFAARQRASQQRYALLFVAQQDLLQARSFAAHLIEHGWHYEPWEKHSSIYVQQAAFATALVLAYCRPFTVARGWPKFPTGLLAHTLDEKALHERLDALRNAVYAHSDVDVNAGQEPPLFDGEDTDLVLSAHASATRGNSC